MYLPRSIYEALPFAYVGGGGALTGLSWLRAEAAWSDAALLVGLAGLVGGFVLLMRRRTCRADAARYDAHSLDDA